MHGCIAKIAIDTIPSSFAIIESNNNISDSNCMDSERSRTMRVNCKQLYTESVGCNIASDSASVKSSQLQIHTNHVVFLQHYPDSLVNYTFVPLTAHLDIRITTRISIYTKKPCQLSLRTIDLPFGIQNQYESVATYPKELSTYPFASLTAISYSESLTFVQDPPQWKLRVYPPQWKLRFDSGDESVYLYSGNKENENEI